MFVEFDLGERGIYLFGYSFLLTLFGISFGRKWKFKYEYLWGY